MIYQVAEKFKSIQGEGLYAGTPMAFIRFVGCSVGKRICQHCDTDFDATYPWRGGGEFTERDLLLWAASPTTYTHVCLTGGEPLDQDLMPLIEDNEYVDMFHIETSGTVPTDQFLGEAEGRVYICVSPKPGWREDAIEDADEIKVIVPGLGEITPAVRDQVFREKHSGLNIALVEREAFDRGFRWPTLDDAKRWARQYPDKPIFLQPRNGKFDIDKNNLTYVMDLLREYPQFRLSDQLHKILKVQ